MSLDYDSYGGFRHYPVFTVQDFRNNAPDETAAIQLAINAANLASKNYTRAVVDLGGEGHYYKLTRNLTGLSNVSILGRGAVLDFGSVALNGGAKYGVKASGSSGAQIALNADAIKGQFSVQTALPPGVDTGDWVHLTNTGSNFYPSTQGNVDRGEIKRVFSVTGAGPFTINFEDAIYDNYPVANAAAVARVNFIENFEVHDVNFIGSGIANDQNRALYLEYVNGFVLNECNFQDVDVYGEYLSSCIRGEISGGRHRGTYYDGVTGLNFYAAAVYDSSQWIRIHDIHAEEVRHLFVCSSRTAGQGFWGSPRFIGVHDNVARFQDTNGAGRSWAFEHHGFGEAINITDNVIDGCYGGIVCRGPGLRFTNNIIRNWVQYAVDITSDLVDGRDIQIEHNTISARAAGGATPLALHVDLTNVNQATLDLRIAHNRFEWDINNAAAANIIGTGVDATGLELLDNKFVCTGGNPSTWVVTVRVNNATMEQNKIYGGTFFMRPFGTGNKFIDNRMEGVAGAASGQFIFSDQPGTIIIGNKGKNVFTMIQLAAGAINSVVKGNHSDAASEARAMNIASGITGLTIRENSRAGVPSSVASTAALALPYTTDYVVISGTADITSIDATGHEGRVVTLRFTGNAAVNGVVNASNLFVSANFLYTADDALTLYCDGTNWFEVGRAVNR